jgi:hypothetical protein
MERRRGFRVTRFKGSRMDAEAGEGGGGGGRSAQDRVGEGQIRWLKGGVAWAGWGFPFHESSFLLHDLFEA